MDRAELLRLLSEHERVSGERLAQRLGVTRAAISKQIDALRREGCEISALPRLGYRLLSVPSPLTEQGVRERLGDHPWAERVSVLAAVDSTNTYLKRAAARGALHGTAVIADCQTQGRGRRGRSFDSAAGTGLYLSVLLRPRCASRELMTLTAQTAVAVRRTLRRVCGVDAGIKWVNDLFLGGKKICGILTELTVEAESGAVDCAVIGVGINCTRTEFPEPLRDIAGSVLSQTGVVPDRSALAAELIRALWQLPAAGDAFPRERMRPASVGDAFPRERMRPASAGDGADWLSEYRAACITLGRQVTVQTPEGERTGVAEDVGPEAELLVRLPTGERIEVNSGEAVF